MPRVAFLLVMAAIFFAQCQTKTEENRSQKSPIKDSLPLPRKSKAAIGIAQPQVLCDSNKAYSYALYLPHSYDASKKFAVAFIFDPQGNGAKPATLYAPLANQYHYILVGSNNCRNGLPWENIKDIAQVMIKDILNKYSIDSKRIYTIGFSGGARIASALAINSAQITGVTAIGAGFQNSNANLTYNFDFFGMAGHSDFNMNELLTLDQMLTTTTTMPHHIHFYEGKHEWPNIEEMNYGFLWHEFQAMKTQKIAVNKILIEKFTTKELNLAKDAKNLRHLDKEYNALSRVVSFTNGLQDVTIYKQNLEKLATSPALLKLQKKREQIKKEEEELSKSYFKSLKTNSLIWWKNEIDKRKKNTIKMDVAQVQMNNRLLGFLGLATYMLANNAVNSNDQKMAEKLLQIYEWLEPANPEVYYLKACMESELGKKDVALASLNKSIMLGFKDYTRLKGEIHFNRINRDPQFLKILAGK